jgi:hypothetical protein
MASPDLVAVNANSLWFSCRIGLATEHLDLLKAVLGAKPPYDDLGFPFGRNYRRGGKWHQEGAWLDRDGAETDEYQLTFKCGVERGERLPKSLRAPQLLLETLAPLGLKATWRCRAEFEYAETEWQSVIPLPLRLVESAALPFDELRGVRAVKLEGDKLVYSVILDRPDNKKCLHSVIFKYDASVEPSLAQGILSEAAKISLSFMKRQE